MNLTRLVTQNSTKEGSTVENHYPSFERRVPPCPCHVTVVLLPFPCIPNFTAFSVLLFVRCPLLIFFSHARWASITS